MFISDLCMTFPIVWRFFVCYLYKIVNFCKDFILTFITLDGIIIQYCNLMQHFLPIVDYKIKYTRRLQK